MYQKYDLDTVPKVLPSPGVWLALVCRRRGLRVCERPTRERRPAGIFVGATYIRLTCLLLLLSSLQSYFLITKLCRGHCILDGLGEATV